MSLKHHSPPYLGDEPTERTFASTALELARDAAGDERGPNARTELPTVVLGQLVPLYPVVEAVGLLVAPHWFASRVSYREGNLMSGDLLTVSEGDSSEICR